MIRLGIERVLLVHIQTLVEGLMFDEQLTQVMMQVTVQLLLAQVHSHRLRSHLMASLPEKSETGYFSMCPISSLSDAALMQELDLSYVGAKLMCVNIYGFQTGKKTKFPRERDVSGCHKGCHVPSARFIKFILCCV